MISEMPMKEFIVEEDIEISQPKILIVDDTIENVDILERILSDSDFIIHRAYDGLQAMEVINEVIPDLILLDVVMPGLSGFEVAVQVKKNPETRLIPIIMITALEGREDRLRGLASGVDDFIIKPVNIFELRARVQNLLKLREYINELEHAEQVIFSLARAVEAKDESTEGHCERLSFLAETLGRKLGLQENDLLILRRGGILHDIGKIAIDDSILSKPGKLTDEEFEKIKKHPEIGERICAPLKTLKPVLPIIRFHQERFDGSGYPDGLKGEDIPIHARIIGVVDCYDALTTNRPYRGPLDKETAIKIMLEETEKGLWDPIIMQVFIGIIEHQYG